MMFVLTEYIYKKLEITDFFKKYYIINLSLQKAFIEYAAYSCPASEKHLSTIFTSLKRFLTHLKKLL